MPAADPPTMADFKQKALEGDGQFAIAFALLRINSTVDQLRRDLCFGEDVGASRVPGVLEHIATSIDGLVASARETGPK